jgi:cellulose synthase/poly-beta-1,6-N-acetylglucosamine synthase-like glycosyltransferase
LIILAIISVFYLLLLIGYTILLGKYSEYFSRLIEFEPRTTPTIRTSIIIPARNEASNINACINALQSQVYEPYEVMVVDDHSADNTAQLASEKNVRVIRMKDESSQTTIAFKKMALATGIRYATGEMILTTDADCMVTEGWTRIMAGRLQETNAVMVAGPVRMVPGKSFLSKFQSLDFAILQGITAASVQAGFHDMSSGANLGYLKTAFEEIDGFKGIDDIATGDDMLLMQKFSEKYPGRIAYAFSSKAIVDTRPEPSWSAFLKQRIRWASKATRYRDQKIFYILLLVYLLNVSLLLLLIMAFFSPLNFMACLIAFALKILAEWAFVANTLRFFGLKKLLPLFPFAQPFHVVYTVLSGTFGQAGPVEWKGRKVK